MHDRPALAYRLFPPDTDDGRAAGSPPVLLLHGFASDGESDWVAPGTVAALTAAGRTVILPDLRGHGASPAPASGAETTAAAQAADLVAVLDGAGAGTFDVAGYSLGARLAWELADIVPGRVRRAVLGGLAPMEPFTGVDVAALHRAVDEGAEPGDPMTGMIAGMVSSKGDRAKALAFVVEGLHDSPFEPKAWAGPTAPVFVRGEDDVMTNGIERIVGVVGGELIVVPGDHFQALAGAEFRGIVVRALGE
ncbi:alpha/beta hydrolase [Sphaerisporangium siamense]|uniref:Pimeloyl-ACP methyl ester carboxylesterase n=1 Tax=Sphaerisporangium siamense TaxID=795645 RepID=A0A7W7D7Q6_9ACTN|nr:alpha/beta fold hydrolase [Sphaerisporangium siamense]MBB4701822.1 pimeloyl-ACP methyl ester carboxylesterase [Sphaerisporangium siamense]GII84270.1 alpha/beta hydrolase [Sphaerisporangium siamense]